MPTRSTSSSSIAVTQPQKPIFARIVEAHLFAAVLGAAAEGLALSPRIRREGPNRLGPNRLYAGAAALLRVSSPAAPSAPPATRTASTRMPIRLMAGSARRR